MIRQNARKAIGSNRAADRRIGTYSKGMRQRIKVAAALAHDPPVLVLDEPFNGMDPRQRLQMFELLHTMADEGRTVLLLSDPGLPRLAAVSCAAWNREGERDFASFQERNERAMARFRKLAGIPAPVVLGWSSLALARSASRGMSAAGDTTRLDPMTMKRSHFSEW